MFGRGLMKFQHGKWTFWVAPGYDDKTIAAEITHFCQDFFSPDASDTSAASIWEVHGGERSTVYGFNYSGKKYCVKVFTDRRIQTRLRTFFGWAKGRRAFKNGITAQRKNIPIPPVYAYAEQKPFGPTLLMMDFLPATQMNLIIEDMVARNIDLPSDPFFNSIIESFSKFTANLHRRSVCHSDFSPRNVLILREEENPGLKLIDLEDVFFSSDPVEFENNINHFFSKMKRYIDSDSLIFFKQKFGKIYREQIAR